MTQVDFYIVGAAGDARLRVACRIAEKAMQRDLRVFIRPADGGEARQLDELLWTFSEGSFVPHRIVEPGAEAAAEPAEPVLIGLEAGAVGGHWDLLINLSGDVPECFSRYARVAEVVDADPERRQQGRERYRYYRDRGYPLANHEV